MKIINGEPLQSDDGEKHARIITYITRGNKTIGSASVARFYPRSMKSSRNPESQCCIVARDVNAPPPAPSKSNIDIPDGIAGDAHEVERMSGRNLNG